MIFFQIIKIIKNLKKKTSKKNFLNIIKNQMNNPKLYLLKNLRKNLNCFKSTFKKL